MKWLRRLTIISLLLFVSFFVLAKGTTEPEKSDFSTPAPTVTTAPLSSFSFAVISDIHSDYQSLQKTLNRIRADDVEFIVVVGDLTAVGSQKELVKVRDILSQSGSAYYVIPGNHDLWFKTVQEDPFLKVFGRKYQAFQKGQFKFILIDNADGYIGIDGAQGEWLKRELANCPKLYCLVFAHMPLNHPLLAHIMGEDNPRVASQAARLVKELVDAQVKELFAGHIHYLSSYELDGLKTTTDGAIYTEKGKQPARFLEVSIFLPQIRLEKKEVWVE
jgi:3',5'-cyclic AMP phosphodiesterase CpdA